tara:strand:- start:487 stop:1107 length:621 start_codon:yes stop_codon:yes gene_type:complete
MIYTLVALLAFFCSTAKALEKDIDIYVDITEVHGPDGSRGTSMPLNILVADEAQRTGNLTYRLHRIAAPSNYTGTINVYDWTNIRHKPGFKTCEYSDSVACGIKNNHWTLRTIVLVGKKYSTVTMKVYNEKGKVIASGTMTAWGKIRWKPQWKLTKIKEAGGWGGGKETEVFEMWPPKMEEIPPLIRPFHVSQARQMTYISLRGIK